VGQAGWEWPMQVWHSNSSASCYGRVHLPKFRKLVLFPSSGEQETPKRGFHQKMVAGLISETKWVS
jgi:hypothetical protein